MIDPRPVAARPARYNLPQMRRCFLAFVAGIVVVAGAVSAPRAQSTAATPCNVTTTERVVAIGDVHGAHDQFVAILRAAGLIDARARWSGGRAVFVQTGDILDRGTDSRKVIDLLRRLEREARSAGGRVIALMGNHEFMRLAGDWRYVSPGEYKAFRDGESMRQAFAAGATYGDWMRARPAVARVNGVVFLHGGISDEAASLGCEAINETVMKETKALPGDPALVPSLFSSGEKGPLWYRGLAQEPESAFAPTLGSILNRMGARAIVVGHTPTPGRMATRFGGRVVQIDTGMLGGAFFPGGVPSALLIEGHEMTAIYLDRREPLGSIPTS